MFAAANPPKKGMSMNKWLNRLISNQPRDHPGKRFYAIDPQEDGTVDVYLAPEVFTYETGIGVKEYDVKVRVVRGVEPWPEIEDDIRARYCAWCESGEEVYL